MLHETNTQTETDLIIRRDGKLDPDFKRRVIKKQAKAVTSAVTGYITYLAANVTKWAIHGLYEAYSESKKNIQLDMMDYKYQTSLRKQYHSGLRTQRILATKRSLNLI